MIKFLNLFFLLSTIFIFSACTNKQTTLRKNTEEDLGIKYFDLGVANQNNGNYQDGIKYYTLYINSKGLGKNKDAAYGNRAGCHLGMDNNEKAIKDYTTAISISTEVSDPDSERDQTLRGKAYLNRGVAYGNIRNYSKAMSDYKKAIPLIKNLKTKAVVYYNITCTYSLKEEKTKALEYLDLAIRHGYNNSSHMEKDTDLDFIRESSEYKKILLKISK